MTTQRALPPPDLQRLLSLFQTRRFEAMERLARDLLQRHPDAGMLWKALGVALQAQGHDAVDALQQAHQLLPDDAELRASLVQAHLSAGHALMKSARPREAAARYAAARPLDERNPHVHACLGAALLELGQLEAAIESFEQALALRPDLADTRFCLGSSLLALGRADEALQSLQCVLESRPDHAPAHANLANALKALGRLDDALPAYRRAIELQPDLPLNHANLGAALRELGQMEQALDCYQRVFDLDPRRLDALSDRLFIQNYLANGTALTRKAEAQRFGALAMAQSRPFTQRRARPRGHGAARLRVGLVSADLREHPVGYFAESMMAALSRMSAAEVELLVYANFESEDALTTRLRTLCCRWTSILRLDDDAAADLIHADRLHVLLDLSGHTAGNRLAVFARRPAPLQVGWLGYCATTGLDAIDCVLVDPWIAPPEADAEFTERLWRLPETFLCFTPPNLDIAVSPLPALTQGHITFGCFNKLNKLDDAVVAAWARVLQAVPASRLFLKSGPLGAEAGRRHLSQRFARHGIGRDRLILEGASPREDCLRAYGRVDIALDPFPYPGGTTSVEGLWMGVPVLTRSGSCALARQGESLLQNVGLPDWIAADTDAYVQRAAAHAGAIETLAALRNDLRPRLLGSPLCDSDRFATHWVEALRTLSSSGA